MPCLPIPVPSHAVAMLLPRYCHAAMPLPCCCHAIVAMSLAYCCHAIAMPLPWCCHANARPCCCRHVEAMPLPCSCHAVAMSFPCCCHVVAMPSCHCCWHAVGMLLPGHALLLACCCHAVGMLLCHCHAIVMLLPCHSMPLPCCCQAVAMPLLCYCYYDRVCTFEKRGLVDIPNAGSRSEIRISAQGSGIRVYTSRAGSPAGSLPTAAQNRKTTASAERVGLEPTAVSDLAAVAPTTTLHRFLAVWHVSCPAS